MRFALGIAFGAVCAVVIACGAARPTPAAPAAAKDTGQRPEAAPGGDPHDEIAALDREIAAQLSRAQVAPPAAACSGAACAAAMAEPFATPTAADPACHPQASARCRDACTLSDSICTSQQRICELANQLAGDGWAAGKCTSARASCQAAHDRCCSCVL